MSFIYLTHLLDGLESRQGQQYCICTSCFSTTPSSSLAYVDVLPSGVESDSRDCWGLICTTRSFTVTHCPCWSLGDMVMQFRTFIYTHSRISDYLFFIRLLFVILRHFHAEPVTNYNYYISPFTNHVIGIILVFTWYNVRCE